MLCYEEAAAGSVTRVKRAGDPGNEIRLTLGRIGARRHAVESEKAVDPINGPKGSQRHGVRNQN